MLNKIQALNRPKRIYLYGSIVGCGKEYICVLGGAKLLLITGLLNLAGVAVGLLPKGVPVLPGFNKLPGKVVQFMLEMGSLSFI